MKKIFGLIFLGWWTILSAQPPSRWSLNGDKLEVSSSHAVFSWSKAANTFRIDPDLARLNENPPVGLLDTAWDGWFAYRHCEPPGSASGYIQMGSAAKDRGVPFWNWTSQMMVPKGFILVGGALGHAIFRENINSPIKSSLPFQGKVKIWLFDIADQKAREAIEINHHSQFVSLSSVVTNGDCFLIDARGPIYQLNPSGTGFQNRVEDFWTKVPVKRALPYEQDFLGTPYEYPPMFNHPAGLTAEGNILLSLRFNRAFNNPRAVADQQFQELSEAKRQEMIRKGLWPIKESELESTGMTDCVVLLFSASEKSVQLIDRQKYNHLVTKVKTPFSNPEPAFEFSQLGSGLYLEKDDQARIFHPSLFSTPVASSKPPSKSLESPLKK